MFGQAGLSRPISADSETYQLAGEQSISNSSTTLPSSESGYDRDNMVGVSFPPPSPCKSDFNPSEAKYVDITRTYERTEVQKEADGFIQGTVSQPAQKPPPKRIETRLRLEQALESKAELEKENKELKEQVLEMEKLKEENKRLIKKSYVMDGGQRSRLDSALQEKKSLEALCVNQSTELQQINSKLAKLAKEKEAALQVKVILEGDKQLLTVELSTKTEELTNNLENLACFQAKCDELKTHCNQLEKERNEIQSKLDVTQKDLKCKTEHLKEAHEDLALAEKIYDDTRETHSREIQIVEGQRNDLQNQVVGLELVKTQLTDDKHILTQKLEQSEGERNELTDLVNKLTSQATAHFGLAEERKKTAGNLKTKLETVEAERDEFRKQKDSILRLLVERNSEQASLKETVQQLRERVSQMESENKRLKEDLNVANRERILFQRELYSMSTSSDGLSATNEANASGNGFSRGQWYTAGYPHPHDHQPARPPRGHFDPTGQQ